MTSTYSFIVICQIVSTLVFKMSEAGTIAPSASAARNLFAAVVLKEVLLTNVEQNVIYSPLSIQSCVALAFFGAKGQTAEEIRTVLKLGNGEPLDIAKDFGSFIKNTFKVEPSEDHPQLRMANRIYVNNKLAIAPQYNEITANYFDSKAEQANFSDAASAVNEINAWVEEQTEKKITNLLKPDTVNEDTSAVLVNAIYFKGKWLSPFSKFNTRQAEFLLSASKKIPIEMMYQDSKFKYADLPDLNASAVELPYINSELSMLVILPNEVDGLSDLEQKLTSVDLNSIANQLQTEDVHLFIPKFKIEFDVDLKEPLQKLGLKQMFSNEADLSQLFAGGAPNQKISDVKHKAFIDVNEAGSEAAAATFMKIVPMCLNLNQKRFEANHPFLFAIRDKSAVYFAGHVVNF